MRLSFAKTVVATLLCFAALGGLTAVVFLGNTNDGTVGIVATAGDLKVDIVDAVSGESLVGGTLDFVCREGEESALFAPGVSYRTVGFRIKNTGEIPINFRLSLSEDGNVDMEAIREAFEFWITTDPTSLDGASRLTEFVPMSPLASQKTTDETLYLVVRMKESADTDYMGKTFSGIGITVLAVQGNPTPEAGE